MRYDVSIQNPDARHPMRRMVRPPRKQRAPRQDDQDLKLFALSFTAFFICIYTMIF